MRLSRKLSGKAPTIRRRRPMECMVLYSFRPPNDVLERGKIYKMNKAKKNWFCFEDVERKGVQSLSAH